MQDKVSVHFALPGIGRNGCRGVAYWLEMNGFQLFRLLDFIGVLVFPKKYIVSLASECDLLGKTPSFNRQAIYY